MISEKNPSIEGLFFTIERRKTDYTVEKHIPIQK